MSFRKFRRKFHANRAIRKERKRAYKIVCDKDQGHLGPGFSAFLTASKFKQSLNEQETRRQKLWRYTKISLWIILSICAICFIFISISGLRIYQ